MTLTDEGLSGDEGFVGDAGGERGEEASHEDGLAMTEPQDVLAEALHDLDNENGHDYKNPAHRRAHNIDAFAILARLSARGYALVRTPETPDAPDVFDRLMELWQQPWSEPAYGEAQALLAALRTPKPEGDR